MSIATLARRPGYARRRLKAPKIGRAWVYRVLGARPILREPRPVVVADAFDEALALLVQWRTPSPRPRSSSATRKRYFGAAAKAR
jgi:hypothetical protein